MTHNGCVPAPALDRTLGSVMTRSLASDLGCSRWTYRGPRSVERLSDLHHSVQREPLTFKGGRCVSRATARFAGVLQVDHTPDAHPGVRAADSLRLGGERLSLFVTPGLAVQQR